MELTSKQFLTIFNMGSFISPVITDLGCFSIWELETFAFKCAMEIRIGFLNQYTVCMNKYFFIVFSNCNDVYIVSSFTNRKLWVMWI